MSTHNICFDGELEKIIIAPDKRFFQPKIMDIFSHFSVKYIFMCS